MTPFDLQEAVYVSLNLVVSPVVCLKPLVIFLRFVTNSSKLQNLLSTCITG